MAHISCFHPFLCVHFFLGSGKARSRDACHLTWCRYTPSRCTTHTPSLSLPASVQIYHSCVRSVTEVVRVGFGHTTRRYLLWLSHRTDHTPPGYATRLSHLTHPHITLSLSLWVCCCSACLGCRVWVPVVSVSLRSAHTLTTVHNPPHSHSPPRLCLTALWLMSLCCVVWSWCRLGCVIVWLANGGL